MMQEGKARTARTMWCKGKGWEQRPSPGVALAKSTDTLLLVSRKRMWTKTKKGERKAGKGPWLWVEGEKWRTKTKSQRWKWILEVTIADYY